MQNKWNSIQYVALFIQRKHWYAHAHMRQHPIHAKKTPHFIRDITTPSIYLKLSEKSDVKLVFNPLKAANWCGNSVPFTQPTLPMNWLPFDIETSRSQKLENCFSEKHNLFFHLNFRFESYYYIFNYNSYKNYFQELNIFLNIENIHIIEIDIIIYYRYELLHNLF